MAARKIDQKIPKVAMPAQHPATAASATHLEFDELVATGVPWLSHWGRWKMEEKKKTPAIGAQRINSNYERMNGIARGDRALSSRAERRQQSK